MYECKLKELFVSSALERAVKVFVEFMVSS